MQQFLALTVTGIVTYGCVYALTALGLVVTYTTSGIFNFAQGAVAMMSAFVYWQFNQDLGWPAWAAFILVAFIIAPAVGFLIEWGLMRRLTTASLEAKLTVTIGLLLFFVALATTVWNPQTARVVPQFFGERNVTIGGVVVSYDQLIVVIVAILVVLGLRLFLYQTRPGVAMRAIVDDRELASMAGAVPTRYSASGWGLGFSLAAIAGILLAPTAQLDITTLTLLVVNGYAAAMVGRLRSLPLTFIGAIILGLVQSYAIGYLPVSEFWTTVSELVPMIFLFIAIIVLPQNRASIARRARLPAPRVANLKRSLVVALLFMAAAILVSQFLSLDNLSYANNGVALALVMLSLVLVTGYGGQVSLCQLTFAGLGAYAMAKVGGSGGSLLGLLAAVGLSAAIGILVALPTLRLRGLYLGLATFAFAYAMDTAFFSSTQFFGQNDSLTVARPHIPWLSLASNRTYFVAECLVFAAAGVAVLALRRSLFGRRLLAISDSPAGTLTLGVDINRWKLLVFGGSAGLAGLGGALYGGSQGSVGPTDFAFLLSLTLVLFAVILGIRSVCGMFLGGVVLALGPPIQSHISSPNDIVQLLVGMAAIGVAQNPEGISGGNTPLQRWRPGKRGTVAAPVSERAAEGMPADVAS